MASFTAGYPILMSMSLAFIAPETSLYVYSWMLSSTIWTSAVSDLLDILQQ